MLDAFDRIFEGKCVLVTGHTGFKGSWLSIWLNLLGARVIGFSLDPPTTPSNFKVSQLAKYVTDVRADVRDLQRLREAIRQYQPEVVFHLAAQPIVLQAYQEPRDTFDINVVGTVNVLEAVRTTSSVKAVVCITSDKVYENREWVWGYREIDRLGGHDPYSTSKAMAELAIASYRRSFVSKQRLSGHSVAIASARAGNVIGGGDWAPHRLVPDCLRALAAGESIHLRHPGSVRPWMHVLESLAGYLWLARKLLQTNGYDYAEAWNFGPLEQRGISAVEVVKTAIGLWGGGSYTTGTSQSEVETGLLKLDWDKAAHHLRWRPAYTWKEALSATVKWFKAYQTQLVHAELPAMHHTCVEQIKAYTGRAHELAIPWAIAAL